MKDYAIVVTGAGMLCLTVSASVQRRVAVLNLAIQGQAAAAVTCFALVMRSAAPDHLTMAVVLAILAACVASTLVGLVLFVLCYVEQFDEMLVGLALNAVSIGVCGWSFAVVVGRDSVLLPITIPLELVAWATIPFVAICVLLTYLFTVRSEAAPALWAIQQEGTGAFAADIPVTALRMTAIIGTASLTALAALLIILPKGWVTKGDWSMPYGFMALALASIGRGRISTAIMFSGLLTASGRLSRWWAGEISDDATKALLENGLPLTILIVGALLLTKWPQKRKRPHHDAK